jgi:hypothetical protein
MRYGWRTCRFLGGEHIGPTFPSPERAGDWFRDEGFGETEPSLKLYVKEDDGHIRSPEYVGELAPCHIHAFGNFK